MKPTLNFFAAAALAAASAFAQPLTIEWHSIASGGASAGGSYFLDGGIASEGAVEMIGGGLTLAGGFSIGPDAFDSPEIIFDSTSGISSGLQFATATSWTGTKICFGDTYSLNSITIPLDTREPNNPPIVHLRIYTDAPGPSKPLAVAEVVMNLSGATNPIEFTFAASSYVRQVTWKPAVPFVLEAGRCYWVVPSTESGEILFNISATPPLGKATGWGRSYTHTSGAAWTTSDPYTFPMMVRATALPAPIEPVTLFDNTEGSNNGGFGVTATTWLASRFCLGATPHDLESVSLLLNSQDFSGAAGPPSEVQLRLYSQDPATGKPSASLGVAMILSGKTNPIVLVRGQELVQWTPATPFTLQADTCYWAVLSAQDGVRLGQIATFTTATGEAAAFGASVSANSGATWATPGEGSNNKMLVRGFPVEAPPSDWAVDQSTAIPGGSGSFASLFAPSLTADNLVFYGTGSGAQQGLYLANQALPGDPYRIADLSTPIPGGAGNFTSLGSEAGIIIVSGNTGIFPGTGADGQKGVYASVMVPPQIGEPFRVADTGTPIPGGSGTFTDFSSEVDLSGNHAVFGGSGAGGQKGIYAAVMVPPQVGSPFRIADTSTTIPEGSGVFTEFPSGARVSGNSAVFAANGAGGQKGVYAAVMVPPQVTSPLRIADTATPIPGGSGNFTSFGSEAGIIIVSGKNTVFTASGTGGQKGIYGAKLLSSGLRALALHGSEISGVSAPFVLADTSTSIPGGTGTFTDFGEVSLDGESAAFLGAGVDGQSGVYWFTSEQLYEVISVGDTFKGRTITGLAFSRHGLSGGQVAFQATFGDGTQGLDTIDLPPAPAEPCRITAVEKIGDALRVTFTSVAGKSYEIQSRANLSAGEWMSIPDPTVAGSSTTQQTLVIPGGEPQRFYRIQALP